MPVYAKSGGTWQSGRPYIKLNGAWVPLNEVDAKYQGTWQQIFRYNLSSVVSPGLSLVSTNGYLQVGVIFTDPQPNLRRVHILYGTSSYPTSQYGGNEISGVDGNYAAEPWSDWYYNATNGHGDGSGVTYKRFPASGTVAAGTYYFSAWSQDNSGNWSDPAQAQITIGGAARPGVTKTQTWTPTYSGTYSTTGWATGDLIQQGSPPSRGLYFYGTAPGAAIGSSYGNTSVSINAAYVYLTRTDTNGQPTANITGFLHNNANPGSIATPFAESFSVPLGTLSVGESNWFQLPSSWYPTLLADTNVGIGISYKAADATSATASDYSVLAGNSDVNARAGQLRVSWTENS